MYGFSIYSESQIARIKNLISRMAPPYTSITILAGGWELCHPCKIRVIRDSENRGYLKICE